MINSGNCIYDYAHSFFGEDFGGNLHLGIWSNFPGILGIFIFLKYMFSTVIDQLFEYSLYKTAKQVIDFLITPRILGILENVEEKSRDFLLERDWKLYSCNVWNIISREYALCVFKDISTPRIHALKWLYLW